MRGVEIRPIGGGGLVPGRAALKQQRIGAADHHAQSIRQTLAFGHPVKLVAPQRTGTLRIPFPDLPPAIAVIGDDDATAGAGDRHLDLALPQRPRPLQGECRRHPPPPRGGGKAVAGPGLVDAVQPVPGPARPVWPDTRAMRIQHAMRVIDLPGRRRVHCRRNRRRIIARAVFALPIDGHDLKRGDGRPGGRHSPRRKSA